MDKHELNIVCRLLSRLESTRGADFKRALKENSVEHCEIFGGGDGVLVVMRDENYYDAVCSFRRVLKDYDTLKKIEQTVTGYLARLEDDGGLCFSHGGEQIYLNNFVCKLNFEKPHYGLEYKLKRGDFAFGQAGSLMGLEAEAYAYDRADELFDLNSRAFAEQTLRAGHPEGYDEEDVAYLYGLFGTPDGEKSFHTFRLDGKLIGYTLFEGGYCDRIALDPDCQGRGFGRAMLAYAIEKAFADSKIKSVRLHTFMINVKAQRLYESLGFKRVGWFCMNDAKSKDKLCFEIKNPAAAPVR